ncbi:MAG: CpsB/CapC family capsule biosynthesis tyrosine phosphatase [Myxococcota bacterium]
MGLVDLHLHLLPGVDDGSKSLDDSLAMARALVGLGFTTLAPSPHHRPEYASRSRELCATKLEEVRAALDAAGLGLALHSNAENYFLDEELLPDAASGKLRLLGTGKVLLIEAPYQGPLPMLSDVVFRLKLKGVTPLIAHPERCFEFERKGRAAELVQHGALLQLDVGALIGRYGKTPQKLARRFLDDGLYAVAATDLHSPVKAEQWVGDSLAALEKAVGKTGFDELFRIRPAKLLVGDTSSST